MVGYLAPYSGEGKEITKGPTHIYIFSVPGPFVVHRHWGLLVHEARSAPRAEAEGGDVAIPQ